MKFASTPCGHSLRGQDVKQKDLTPGSGAVWKDEKGFEKGFAFFSSTSSKNGQEHRRAMHSSVGSGWGGGEPLFRTDVHHRWSRKEMSPSTGTSYYMGRGPTGRCCSGHVLLFVVRVLCFDPGSKESSKTSQVDGRWTLVGWSAREKQSGQRRPA